MVDLVAAPTPAGSSLKLGDLNNVATNANTAAAGMLLGTTSTGQWAPIANPADGIGNLLTANQASAGDTLGDNIGFPGVGVAGTYAYVVTDAWRGAGCLQMTSVADGNVGVYLAGPGPSNRWPVVGGATYTLAAAAKAVGNSRLFASGFEWFTAAGASAGVAWPTLLASVPTASWAFGVTAAVAPANAAYVRLSVVTNGSRTGDVMLVDCFGFWRGAGGAWAMPGVPIVNQGIRTSTPNGTDQLTEVWDDAKATWVPVRYWSGVRTVTGGKALRENSTVTWTGTDAKPAGFRDTYATGGKTFQTGDPLPTSLPGTPG
jgi:hypothetical protein